MRPLVNLLPTETVTLDQLTTRQAAFVREFVARGGAHGAACAAAIAAGYARDGQGGMKSVRARAFELLRNPKVLGAIRDESIKRLSAGVVVGVETLIDLASNAKSEQTRLSAANSLLDRTIGPPVSRTANFNMDTSLEDLLAKLDAKEEARTRGDIIEGRGREVSAEAEDQLENDLYDEDDEE